MRSWFFCLLLLLPLLGGALVKSPRTEGPQLSRQEQMGLLHPGVQVMPSMSFSGGDNPHRAHLDQWLPRLDMLLRSQETPPELMAHDHLPPTELPEARLQVLGPEQLEVSRVWTLDEEFPGLGVLRPWRGELLLEVTRVVPFGGGPEHAALYRVDGEGWMHRLTGLNRPKRLRRKSKEGFARFILQQVTPILAPGRNAILGLQHGSLDRLLLLRPDFTGSREQPLPDLRCRLDLRPRGQGEWLGPALRLSSDQAALEVLNARGRRLALGFTALPGSYERFPGALVRTGQLRVGTDEGQGTVWAGFAYPRGSLDLVRLDRRLRVQQRVRLPFQPGDDGRETYRFPEEWLWFEDPVKENLALEGGLGPLCALEKLLPLPDGSLLVVWSENRLAGPLRPGRRPGRDRHYVWLDLLDPSGRHRARGIFRYGMPICLDAQGRILSLDKNGSNQPIILCSSWKAALPPAERKEGGTG